MRTRVTRVDVWGAPGRERFWIRLGGLYGKTVTTTNPYFASLADQAWKQQKDVEIRTRSNRPYCDEVTAVQIVEASQPGAA